MRGRTGDISVGNIRRASICGVGAINPKEEEWALSCRVDEGNEAGKGEEEKEGEREGRRDYR